jgi:hypothetical protein
MTRPERVELDLGLCRLTIQLTFNESIILQALLNSPDRTHLHFHLGGNAPAEFVLARTIVEKEKT